MYSNPDDAAAIVAKVYNLDLAVAQGAIHNLVSSKTAGMPYWGAGNFDFEGMDRMIRAQKLVGALSGDVDWSKLVDTSFLPDDLKK
jgi:NitT/TauT family transport system substrate-binding protein